MRRCIFLGLGCWMLAATADRSRTFVVEFLPIVDMLPTWTGCVAMVIALRRRQMPGPPASGPVIDV